MSLDREAYAKWWELLGSTEEEREKRYRELCGQNADRNSPVGQYAQALLDGVDYMATLPQSNHWNCVAKSLELKEKKKV